MLFQDCTGWCKAHGKTIGQLEKAAQGDIPPTAQQVAARQRTSLRT